MMNTALKLLILTSFDLFKKGQWGNWTEVSDRVRGGVSYSTFTNGVFRGVVDSSILKAGFAGQESRISLSTTKINNIEIKFNTVDDSDNDWKGIEIFAKGDGKIFSLRLLDPSSQSGHAYKIDHAFSTKGEVKQFLWSDFKESVRGRDTGRAFSGTKEDRERIEKVGVMCQSYFGKQNGEFEFVVDRISLFK